MTPRDGKVGAMSRGGISKVLRSADPQETALRRILILLEDSEQWAGNYLRQSPAVRKVDVDRMAASIVDALAVVRGVLK